MMFSGRPELAGLGDQHCLLAFQRRGIDTGDVQRLGAACRNVHADLAAKRLERRHLATAIDGDEHADLAQSGPQRRVHVGRDRPVRRRQHAGTADGHVLADLGDQLGQLLTDGHRAVRELRRLDGIQVLADLQRDIRHRFDERLELVVAGDKIGLGVHLDHGRAAGGGGDPHQPVGGDTARLLCRGGEAFQAQPVDRGFDVAGGLGQRTLAVHHACASLLAQVLHQGGGDLRHGSISHCLRTRPGASIRAIVLGPSVLGLRPEDQTRGSGPRVRRWRRLRRGPQFPASLPAAGSRPRRDPGPRPPSRR